MALDYSIVANSEENFKKIDTALKEFDNFYKISCEGPLQAKNLIDNLIQIFPESKHGKINEVSIKKNKLKGYLLKSNPEFSLILLGENRFDINYENPNFKE